MITRKSSLVHVGPFPVEKVVTEGAFPRTSLLDVLMSRLVIWPCASCWRRRLEDCRSCFSFSAIRLSKDRTWNKISKDFKGLHLYSQGDDDEGNHIMSYDTIPYDINNVENHNNEENRQKVVTFSAWALSLSPSCRPTLSAIVRPSARSCSSWWPWRWWWRSRLCPEVVIPPCCLFSDHDWFYCYQRVFFVLKLDWENICVWIISCSSLLAPKTKLASGFAVGRIVYGKPIALNMGRQGSGQCCAVFPDRNRILIWERCRSNAKSLFQYCCVKRHCVHDFSIHKEDNNCQMLKRNIIDDIDIDEKPRFWGERLLQRAPRQRQPARRDQLRPAGPVSPPWWWWSSNSSLRKVKVKPLCRLLLVKLPSFHSFPISLTSKAQESISWKEKVFEFYNLWAILKSKSMEVFNIFSYICDIKWMFQNLKGWIWKGKKSYNWEMSEAGVIRKPSHTAWLWPFRWSRLGGKSRKLRGLDWKANTSTLEVFSILPV